MSIMAVRRSLSIAALFIVSACSGATSTELFDGVSQESNPAAPIAGEDPGSGSSSSGSTDGTSPSSGGTSGNTSSGNPPPAGPDGGTPPPAGGCVAEQESNDGPELTNWFTECFTGAVKKGDIDYASVSAPITAKRIDVKHEETGGGVLYRMYVNGVAYDSFSTDSPTFIPVFGGATYSFEMSPFGGGGAGNRTYTLTVKFE